MLDKKFFYMETVECVTVNYSNYSKYMSASHTTYGGPWKITTRAFVDIVLAA